MFALRIMSICAVLNVYVFARPNTIVERSDDVPALKVVNFNAVYKDAIKFPCKPQPRAFLAKDLFTDPQDASYSFQPNNVVLHRCDKQSGCCLNDTQYCGESKSEEVIIQLRGVILEVREGSASTRATKIFETKQLNHTACSCAGDSSPKRNSDINDARIESLTSAGLTNNPNEYKLSLCVASLLYFIYLSYSFCL